VAGESETTFRSFGSLLDLRHFERENRRRLARCFVLAAGMLALLAVFSPPLLREMQFRPERPYRIIVTDIIEMPIQHYSEPFLIRKPQSHRAFIRRETGVRLPSGKIAAKQAPLPGEDTLPLIEPEIGAIPEPADSLRLQSYFLPKTEYKPGIKRQLERRLSLEEEGLNLQDIDNLGLYKGYIIQNPEDKKKVRGFAYIPALITGIPLGYSLLGAAFSELALVSNIFMNLEVRVDPPVSLSSPNLLKYPVIYITSAADTVFELSPVQVQRFGDYLRKGGFAIVDNGSPWYDFTPAKASLLNILCEALGDEARFEPIPEDHRLLHCFHDFNGPLPVGAKDRAVPVRRNKYETWKKTGWMTALHLDTDSLSQGGPYLVKKTLRVAFGRDPHELPSNIWGRLLGKPELEALRSRMAVAPDCLWGVWIGNRLAAVYSDRGYGHLWQEGMQGYARWYNRPAMELGMNMLVFSLTQPGGIAQLYVDWSAEGKAYASKPDWDIPVPKPKDLIPLKALMRRR
jgi:hypothetical protein